MTDTTQRLDEIRAYTYSYVVAKTRFEFWIDAEARLGLETIKERDGIPVAEQIRRAIAAWLAVRNATDKAAPRRVGARRKA